jgi:hypothetical protein
MGKSADHYKLIAKSIRELYRTFGAAHLQSFADNFTLGNSIEALRGDPLIGAQYLAKRIGAHYRLPVTTVIVSFSSSLKPPGQVELSQSNEFFVELQSKFKEAPEAVAAILAHEVAHIFLHRCGVRFQDAFENEVLTDTTAVYVGFGPVIMNAATQSKVNLSSNVVQTRTNYFGYLTLEEFGYIQAKRDDVVGLDSFSTIASGPAQSAFLAGKKRMYSERRKRPYVPPTVSVSQWVESIWRRFFPGPPREQGPLRHGRFECVCCSQELRIPAIGKQLIVRCPNCDSRHKCYA